MISSYWLAMIPNRGIIYPQPVGYEAFDWRIDMTKMIVEESLRKKLSQVEEEVEFCDESGKLLGIFYPFGKGAFSPPPGMECPISEEELEKRSREPGSRTLKEIWASLRRS
jgi:hypothetical protein